MDGRSHGASPLFLKLAFASILLSGCGSAREDPSPGPEPTPTPFGASLSSSVGYLLLGGAAHLDSPRLGVSQLFSSRDPEPASNEDYNHYLGDEGGNTYLLARHNGPGVITRIWMTSRVQSGETTVPGFDPRAILNVETDGRLLFSLPLNLFFAGGTSPFLHPLVNRHKNPDGVNGRGFYCYVPISFASSVKVTVTNPAPPNAPAPANRFLYQINLLDLSGQIVEPSPIRRADGSLGLSEADAGALEEILSDWRTPLQFANRMELAAQRVAFDGPLERGTNLLGELQGPGRIRGLRIYAPLVTSADLESIDLRISWDGEAQPSVEVPLGTGFGSFYRRGDFQSLHQGSLADGTLYLALPMPFRASARVELVNGGRSHNVTCEIYYDAEPVRDDALYLYGTFNSAIVDAKRRFSVLEVPGRGHFVGLHLVLDSFSKPYGLEGDEFFNIDGVETHGGTGIADLFNAHWRFEGGIGSAALTGVTSVQDPFQPDLEAYRFFVSDAIPFAAQLVVQQENGNLLGRRDQFRAVSFYYLER